MHFLQTTAESYGCKSLTDGSSGVLSCYWVPCFLVMPPKPETKLKKKIKKKYFKNYFKNYFKSTDINKYFN